MIKLIITLPDGNLMTHDMVEEHVTLGSGVENTVVIPHETVAEKHLELLLDTTGYLVADLVGGGATQINGHPVDIGVHYVLETGTSIQVGEVEVVYLAAEIATEAPHQADHSVVNVAGGAKGAFSPGSFQFPRHPEGVFTPRKAQRSLWVLASIAITIFAVAAAAGAGYLSTTLLIPH
jgi:pSer/pThr/pTyr-binding forkhead associated (FHA) protein